MADFVTLRFDRKSIDALNLRAPLFALEQMIVSANAVRDFAGRVRVAFEGYEDTGDVFLDVGVQRYVRELTDLFPYWLHFADKGDDTLNLLMSCLLPPTRVGFDGDGKAQAEINVVAWRDQVTRLTHYMDRLHAQHGLPPEEILRITRSIMDWSQRVGLV